MDSPHSLDELKALADEMGLTGDERRAFLGDAEPPALPKSAAPKKQSASKAPVAKAATEPAQKPVAVAKPADNPAVPSVIPVDDLFVGPPAPMQAAPAPKPPAQPEGVGPRVAAGMAPLPGPTAGKLATIPAAIYEGAVDFRNLFIEPSPLLESRAADAAGYRKVISNAEKTRSADQSAKVVTIPYGGGPVNPFAVQQSVQRAETPKPPLAAPKPPAATAAAETPKAPVVPVKPDALIPVDTLVQKALSLNYAQKDINDILKMPNGPQLLSKAIEASEKPGVR